MSAPTAPAKPLVNRSRALRGRRRLVAYVAVLAITGYVVYSHLKWGYARDNLFLASFFTVMGIFMIAIVMSGVHWRSFTHLFPATGRVLCIVPVYNEEPELVYEVIRSLLRQTILPDLIFVVDDGSKNDIPPLEDPLIRWIKVENGGKRHAQGHALAEFAPTEFDYILTVDSDSVLDDDALEHMLRCMNDERVQAATGMILVRNWNTNLLTRFTDINVVTSCLAFRMLRSWMGIVSPTSGALALYRASVIYDNLEDYLTSGTAGDDRRLSFYALQRGEVVAVSEAMCSTELPDTWRGCFWQRMRWSKSAWLGTPFVVINLRWLIVFFYTLPLLFALLWPVVVLVLTALMIKYQSPVLLYGVLWWMVCSITLGWIYTCYRPGFTFRQRVVQWLLTFIYPVLGLFVLRPACYWSLTQLKSAAWGTREVAQSTFKAMADSQEVEGVTRL